MAGGTAVGKEQSQVITTLPGGDRGGVCPWPLLRRLALRGKKRSLRLIPVLLLIQALPEGGRGGSCPWQPLPSFGQEAGSGFGEPVCFSAVRRTRIHACAPGTAWERLCELRISRQLRAPLGDGQVIAFGGYGKAQLQGRRFREKCLARAQLIAS